MAYKKDGRAPQDSALLALGAQVLGAAGSGGGERYAPKPPPAVRVAAGRAVFAATGACTSHLHASPALHASRTACRRHAQPQAIQGSLTALPYLGPATIGSQIDQ